MILGPGPTGGVLVQKGDGTTVEVPAEVAATMGLAIPPGFEEDALPQVAPPAVGPGEPPPVALPTPPLAPPGLTPPEGAELPPDALQAGPGAPPLPEEEVPAQPVTEELEPLQFYQETEQGQIERKHDTSVAAQHGLTAQKEAEVEAKALEAAQKVEALNVEQAAREKAIQESAEHSERILARYEDRVRQLDGIKHSPWGSGPPAERAHKKLVYGILAGLGALFGDGDVAAKAIDRAIDRNLKEQKDKAENLQAANAEDRGLLAMWGDVTDDKLSQYEFARARAYQRAEEMTKAAIATSKQPLAALEGQKMLAQFGLKKEEALKKAIQADESYELGKRQAEASIASTRATTARTRQSTKLDMDKFNRDNERFDKKWQRNADRYEDSQAQAKAAAENAHRAEQAKLIGFDPDKEVSLKNTGITAIGADGKPLDRLYLGSGAGAMQATITDTNLQLKASDELIQLLERNDAGKFINLRKFQSPIAAAKQLESLIMASKLVGEGSQRLSDKDMTILYYALGSGDATAIINVLEEHDIIGNIERWQEYTKGAVRGRLDTKTDHNIKIQYVPPRGVLKLPGTKKAKRAIELIRGAEKDSPAGALSKISAVKALVSGEGASISQQKGILEATTAELVQVRETWKKRLPHITDPEEKANAQILLGELNELFGQLDSRRQGEREKRRQIWEAGRVGRAMGLTDDGLKPPKWTAEKDAVAE